MVTELFLAVAKDVAIIIATKTLFDWLKIELH
jgi:hypothetical protein